MKKAELAAALKDRILFVEDVETLVDESQRAGAAAADLDQNRIIEGREIDALATVLERKPEAAASFLEKIENRALWNPWPTPAPRTALARGALDSMNSAFADHERRLAETGVGRYVGVKSEYVKKGLRAKQQLLATHAKEGATVSPPVTSSCIDWLLEHVRAGYKAAIADAKARGENPKAWALQSTLNAMNKAVNESKATGFAFCEPLIRAGWKVYVFAPDATNIDTTSPTNASIHLNHINQAKKTGKYYGGGAIGLPVTGFITNYHPTTDPDVLKSATPTTQDLSGIQQLEEVPFYIGLAKGALHTFVGSYGKVNEFHWAYEVGDTEDRAITEDPLKDWGWSSGIILVPPGEWPAPPAS